jgi:hypothetical protein
MRLRAFAFIILSVASCTTEPIDYDLPEPDTSLDPQALSAIPHVIFMCDRWVDGAAPSNPKIFLDVSFIRRGEDDEYEHPTLSDIALVKRHGAQIVHQFHVRAVRIWIPTANVPALGREDDVNLILRVTNLRRYDWLVGAAYRPTYSLSSAVTRFAELGGRVDRTYTSFNGLSGMLPDRSIAELRADASTLWVEGQEGFENCF